MLLTEAATLDRKSGEPRDLQFRGPFVEVFFDGVAGWRDLRFSSRTLKAHQAQRRERSHPVKRTNCSASILVPKIETLGIWPRAIATSSQRYSRGQFWQSL
jgi:hypothetical protein